MLLILCISLLLDVLLFTNVDCYHCWHYRRSPPRPPDLISVNVEYKLITQTVQLPVAGLSTWSLLLDSLHNAALSLDILGTSEDIIFL